MILNSDRLEMRIWHFMTGTMMERKICRMILLNIAFIKVVQESPVIHLGIIRLVGCQPFGLSFVRLESYFLLDG